MFYDEQGFPHFGPEYPDGTPAAAAGSTPEYYGPPKVSFESLLTDFDRKLFDAARIGLSSREDEEKV